jgi:hypothetical protein
VVDARLGGGGVTAGGRGRLARGLFLLRDGDGRADVLIGEKEGRGSVAVRGRVGSARAHFDVLEHKDRVLGGVLELLEEEQRLLVVAQAALDAVICGRRAR